MKRLAIIGWLALLSVCGLFAQTPTTVGPTLAAVDWVSNMVYHASFAAEARAQGVLLFDGTVNQYGATSMNDRLAGSDNIGLEDFTFYTRIFVPSSFQTTAAEGIGSFQASAAPGTTANGILIWRDSPGNLLMSLRGVSGSDQRNAFISGFMTEFAGRWVSLAFARSGNTMTFYVNGLARTTTENTSGANPPADWAYDIINTSAQMAGVSSTSQIWRGKIGRWGILNFAISAADALEMSVQGTPQTLRNGKFRKKILNTLRNSTFAGTATDWAVNGVGATVSLDTTNDEMDVTANANANEGLQLTAGNIGVLRTNVPHRIELDLRNLAGGTVKINNGGINPVGTMAANGKYWFEYTPTSPNTILEVVSVGTGVTYSIANVQITDLGINNGNAMAVSGPGTAGVTSYLLNGSFETAGAGAPDYFSDWVESNVASVWARDVTTAVSGTASAKVVVDGSNTQATLTGGIALEPQRRYRMSYSSKADSTSGSPTLQVSTGGVSVFTNALGTSFAQSSFTFVSRNSSVAITTWTGDTGRTIWIDDVKIEDLGAAIDIDCGPGMGLQAFDRTCNGRHMFFNADLLHDRDSVAKMGVIRGRTTTSGNEQLLGGISIPLNGRIRMMTVNASGSATVNVGTASGGSQLVSAASVAAGRQDLTLVTRYSSTRRIWVNSSAAATLDWTIGYDVVE